MSIFIVLPVHLFEDISHLKNNDISKVYIVEDPFYFSELPFHKMKLTHHRATLKYYQSYLKSEGINSEYIDHSEFESFSKKIKGKSALLFHPEDIGCMDFYDSICQTEYLSNPAFLFDEDDMEEFKNMKRANKDKYTHDGSFYKWSRQKLDVFVDKSGKPLYGQWSFDKENRNKYPANIKELPIPEYNNKFVKEAKSYVNKNFPNHYGTNEEFIYPVTHEESRAHFKKFVSQKLKLYGPYQDAVSEEILFGYHSFIASLLNKGLLTPEYVVEHILSLKIDRKNFPSVEGFIRQIIGWREYMRFIYRYYGRKIPKMNFFGNTKKIPDSWYSDDIKITDVEIIDPLFMKTWNYGYLNHIERLMVMGNFCLYNGFHPKDVYEWFMICFIDSYDWVMYTNVYGMSQYAFTDLSITSRPYICSSSYILKMSSYKKGDWVDQWDELLYEFVGKHQSKLKKLYRMYVFINMWKKWKKNNI